MQTVYSNLAHYISVLQNRGFTRMHMAQTNFSLKLTPSDRAEILSRKETPIVYARRFGVNVQSIYNMQNKRQPKDG